MANFEKVYSIQFETKKAQTAIRALEKALSKLDKKAIALAANLAKGVGVLGGMNKILLEISLNSKKTGKAIDKFIGERTVKATKKAEKSVKKLSNRFKNFEKGLQTFGRNMSMYVTLPVVGAGVASLKFARDFNQGMANVSTLLTGGKYQVEGLKKGIIELSKDTGKSVGDLSEGLYMVVSALGESAENMKQLNVATRMGVGGRSTTSEAIGLLSATTKGYGDSSEKAMKKVSDLSFQTVKLGVTTIPELAASMGKVIPLAAAMGTSQEELFGTMATLTGVTGNSAEVTTQIASVYSAMLKPSNALTEAVQKLGYESAATMMKEVGFRQSLININKAAGGNESVLAKMLKRKEALVGALALLNGQSGEYTRKLGEMEKAAGSTDEAYRKQTEGVNAAGHQWEQTKRNMEAAAIAIGDRLLPVLSRLLDMIIPMADYISNLSDENLEWIIGIAATAAAIGPLIKALGLLKIAMTFLIAHPVVAVLVATAAALLLIKEHTNMLSGGFEYLITSLEKLWKYYKKFTTGAAVTFFGKIFGIDMSGSEYSMAGYDRDIEDADRRMGGIDYRKQDVIDRESGQRKAVSRTASNIKKYSGGGAGISNEWSMQSLAGAGAGGGTNIGGTTINFNGPVADPEKAMRQARRGAAKMDRDRASVFNGKANNAGPMEQ